MNLKASMIFLSMILLSGISPGGSEKVPDYDGEIMQYTIRYGIINVGEAIISFGSDSTSCGSYIKAEARSTGIARFFKSVNYCFESCMDTVTGLPNYSSMSLIDKRCKVQNELVFDQDSRQDSSIVHSEISGMHVVPKNIHDLLTAYYCFRENHISESVNTGQDIVIKIFIADILWDLKIKYVGKETIKTKYGKIECLKYNPSTVAGNFFKNEDDMIVWFTDDADHIPVRIQLNMILGSLKSDLVAYQEPK
ncbi:MAG: DUF3108 domain-containing protein [Bacteroidales bacterium]|nr:DUF3108 domain-containing protein [Bacteroidales bacterium]